MYKDKDKRRDKERDRQRRYRASKGVTGVTEPKGVTNEAQTSPMLDAFKDENIRRQEYEDKLDLLKTLAMKDTGGKPKRGKDIKAFADLPPDVQATINRVSQSNEEKQKRTAAAIKYQHLFPDRFHSTGYVGTPNLGQAQTAEIGELR